MIKNILMALPWYHHKLHKGISRFVAEHHWHLNADWSRYRHKPTDWFGDGIITQGIVDKEFEEFVRKKSVPTVTISPYSYVESPKVYDPDDYIAEVAYEYFVQKGFSHFASYSNLSWPHGRLTEFHKILEKKKKWNKTLHLGNEIPFNERVEKIVNFIKSSPQPLAVFCPNDEVGAEFILAATMSGIKIPQEVAVLGVHNDELSCESTAIPLSSIDCGLEQMGYEAANILNKMMNGEGVPEFNEIRCAKVVTRASTDTLAIENQKIRAALEFIQKNFSKAITIEEIAHAGSLSISGIQYIFKSQLDSSPTKELNRIRLNFAKEMLIKKSWSVEMVAKESGFGTNRHFYRVFEKSEKMTPASFRKRYQNLS